MKQIDKNALVDWEKYKEDVMRSTPVDQSMSHAERERHRIYLEAHPIEWIKFFYPGYAKYEFADFQKRAIRRILAHDEWYEVLPIADHQCHNWLETEYNTAVLRARQAANWQQFQAEKDILPNLKWLPSTSPNPGADHRPFWNTILPVDHPFWNEHRPGDRWNCKCDLTSTDEPPTTAPSGSPAGNDPQPGLKDNPGKSQAVFSDDHPYFPADCKHCAFYKPGVKARIANIFHAQTKDCYHCPYIDGCINKIDGYVEDKTYGKRLLVNERADQTELVDNIRAAKALLDSFQDMVIKIREHVLIHGVKNPEYEINGLIADRKGIKSEKGISSGFSTAIKQGCKAVVIDLDMNMGSKPLKTRNLSGKIYNRHLDFEEGKVKECYVVYHGKAVLIDATMFIPDDKEASKELISEILNELL